MEPSMTDPSRHPSLPPRCARTFEIQRALASGGFGAVYVARQVELDRPVALKVLHHEGLTDPDTLARFSDEARAAAEVQHPSIVRVLDHDVEDGRPWIAYELVDGEPLDAVLRRGPLGWAEALVMGREIASALEAVHERGIVHRDVKPANVIRSRAGVHKLTDFGIARFAAQSHRTAAGVIVGTPVYMAPEVIRGETPTGAADVYALGVMLHEAISGAPPFADDSPQLVLAMHTQRPAPVLETPGLPPPVARSIAAMLAKAPEARPTAAAVERALAAFEKPGESARARTAVISRPERSAPRGPTSPSARSAAPAVVACGALVLLIALAVRLAPAPAPASPSPASAAAPADEHAAVQAELARDLAAFESAERDGRSADAERAVDRAIERIVRLGQVKSPFASVAPLGVAIVKRLDDTKTAIEKERDPLLRGFDAWHDARERTVELAAMSRRDQEMKYIDSLRGEERARIDATAARLRAHLEVAGPLVHAAFAIDLPPVRALDAAYYTMRIRECTVTMHGRRREPAVDRFPREVLRRLPPTWAVMALEARLDQVDGRPTRKEKLRRAFDLFEERFRGERSLVDRRLAAGMLIADQLEARRRPFFDRASDAAVLARWRFWRDAGPLTDPRVSEIAG
jgi:hypothetical protein